ncbi:MAG: hypothetical protein ACOZJZ_12695 [Pseudomonadota bacterium]
MGHEDRAAGDSPPVTREDLARLEASIALRLEAGSKRMDLIEEGLTANTKATQGIEGQLGDFLEFLTSVRGGFKVLGWLGSLVKWAAPIAAALYGAWQHFKGGK